MSYTECLSLDRYHQENDQHDFADQSMLVLLGISEGGTRMDLMLNEVSTAQLYRLGRQFSEDGSDFRSLLAK